MKKTQTSPDSYIASLPEPNQDDIKKLDQMISKVMARHSRVMWEGVFWGGSEQKIIGYGDLTYINSAKKPVEWFVIGLALQKNYISVFVNAVDSKVYLTEKYKDKLGKVKVGRSSIGFNSVEDINLDVLEELVKKAEELSNS